MIFLAGFQKAQKKNSSRKRTQRKHSYRNSQNSKKNLQKVSRTQVAQNYRHQFALWDHTHLTKSRFAQLAGVVAKGRRQLARSRHTHRHAPSPANWVPLLASRGGPAAASLLSAHRARPRTNRRQGGGIGDDADEREKTNSEQRNVCTFYRLFYW